MSHSNYKHKSGAQKRKLKSEKESKILQCSQPITKFIKSHDEKKEDSDIKFDEVRDDRTEMQIDQNQIMIDIPGTSGQEKTFATCDPGISGGSGEKEIIDTKHDDPATWPLIISNNLRENIVQTITSGNLEKIYKELPTDMSGKTFQKSLLYTKTKDERTREQFPREWLMWSVSKKALYCLPCRIFCNQVNKNVSSLAQNGFSPTNKPWKKLYDILPQHENSAEHRKQYITWKFLLQSMKGQGIDKDLQLQIQCETAKWKAILQRIIDVTLFLSSRGLAFQGDNTKIGDTHNGNFLGILELIGKYDEITRQHLAKIQKNQIEEKSMKGHAHYLSWQSQNEFIGLCANKVLQTILQQRRDAIFYGIIVDATPDISHVEQNVLILRYVSQNCNSGEFEISERFIQFMTFNEKTGESIMRNIITCLNNNNIPLDDCRSQGYDNGANMRGEIKGVKSRILEKNKYAIFSPCAAHSLNRTGVNAAKINSDIITFFGNIESFYSLFSHSPARWEVLKKYVPLSLQTLSETRWSERIQAIRPIVKHYPGILAVLDVILDEMTTELTPSALNLTKALKKYFRSFKGLLMTVFWHKVLQSIDNKNVIIQSQGISLDVEIKLTDDLVQEMQHLRNSWENIIEEAKTVAENIGVDTHFPKQRKMSAEPDKGFKISVFYPVLDFIITDLRSRFEAAHSIYELFSPILNFHNLDDNELSSKAERLAKTYEKDLSENLLNEIFHLKSIYETVFNNEKNPIKLLNAIYEKNLQGIFANICLAIKLFCTIPITVSSAERSFSKLANSLKTWQRSTTSQERLNHLAILCIENDLAKLVDYADIIHDFASMKARKCNL